LLGEIFNSDVGDDVQRSVKQYLKEEFNSTAAIIMRMNIANTDGGIPSKARSGDEITHIAEARGRKRRSLARRNIYN
jgi:hypothetical protein